MAERCLSETFDPAAKLQNKWEKREKKKEATYNGTLERSFQQWNSHLTVSLYLGRCDAAVRISYCYVYYYYSSCVHSTQPVEYCVSSRRPSRTGDVTHARQ